MNFTKKKELLELYKKCFIYLRKNPEKNLPEALTEADNLI